MAGALAQIGCIPYLRGMILPTIFKLSVAVTTEDDCRVGEGLATGVMKLKAMGIGFAAHRTTRSVCTKTFVCFLQAPFGVEFAHFLALIANVEPTNFYRWLKRACRDRSSAGWAAAENHRPTADNG